MSITIAFLGLGNMGAPMAANLVNAGYTVTGYDPVPDTHARAAADGVGPATSAAEATAGAQVVITMLPSGNHIVDCYSELVPLASPGTLFLDCSTVDVATTRQAAALATEAGHLAVDAPVSGGVVGAEAGSLTFMVGGEQSAFAAANPILRTMGARTVHCGHSGSGQTAKICNNMILGVSMIAVGEAFVLGEKLGLTNQALFDVASSASGQCWALTTNCPVPGPVPTSPANRAYTPGFSTGLMRKDLGLAQSAADSAGVHTVLGRAAADIYDAFVASDGPARDFSAIVEAIRSGDVSTQHGSGEI